MAKKMICVRMPEPLEEALRITSRESRPIRTRTAVVEQAIWEMLGKSSNPDVKKLLVAASIELEG